VFLKQNHFETMVIPVQHGFVDFTAPMTHFFHFVAKVHVKMLHKAETFFYFDELWTVKMIPRTDKKDKVDLKVLTSMNSQLGTLTWEFCQESNKYLISFKKSSQQFSHSLCKIWCVSLGPNYWDIKVFSVKILILFIYYQKEKRLGIYTWECYIKRGLNKK